MIAGRLIGIEHVPLGHCSSKHAVKKSLYFEPQTGAECARIALNNGLQGPVFTTEDFRRHAREHQKDSIEGWWNSDIIKRVAEEKGYSPTVALPSRHNNGDWMLPFMQTGVIRAIIMHSGSTTQGHWAAMAHVGKDLYAELDSCKSKEEAQMLSSKEVLVKLQAAGKNGHQVISISHLKSMTQDEVASLKAAKSPHVNTQVAFTLTLNVSHFDLSYVYRTGNQNSKDDSKCSGRRQVEPPMPCNSAAVYPR